MKKLNLDELRALIDERGPHCICGAALRGSGVDHWGPHDGGYPVEGYPEKRWVYVHCGVCGYDVAVWKIARELGDLIQSQRVKP